MAVYKVKNFRTDDAQAVVEARCSYDAKRYVKELYENEPERRFPPTRPIDEWATEVIFSGVLVSPPIEIYNESSVA